MMQNRDSPTSAPYGLAMMNLAAMQSNSTLDDQDHHHEAEIHEAAGSSFSLGPIQGTRGTLSGLAWWGREPFRRPRKAAMSHPSLVPR